MASSILDDRKFTWDVSGVFGQANIQTSTSGIIDGRLLNALDAVKVDNTYLTSLVTAAGSTITDRNGDHVIDAADALIALQPTAVRAAFRISGSVPSSARSAVISRTEPLRVTTRR